MKKGRKMNKKQRLIEAKKKKHKKTSPRNRYSPNKHLNYAIARMIERKQKGESYTKWQRNTMKKALRRRYPMLIN